jgi:hypothetical protein
LLAVLQLSVYGCASGTYNQAPNREFVEAAKAAGAPIRADEIVTHRSGTQIVSVAPITTWEHTPATALRNGVDVAFVHFSTATQQIPAGYYTLRASANVENLGSVPARIQFIDRDGKVAGSQEAITEVHSLTIPAVASTRTTYTTIDDDGLAPNPAERRIIIVICCPNGDCFIIVIERRSL